MVAGGAAEAGFAEFDHPGPVSGGGSSGIDGCSGELMLRETVDVPAAYRDTLTDTGWQVRQYEADLVTARKDGQDFEAARDEHGSWWIWIGPAGLKPQPTSPGQVSPRRCARVHPVDLPCGGPRHSKNAGRRSRPCRARRAGSDLVWAS